MGWFPISVKPRPAWNVVFELGDAVRDDERARSGYLDAVID
jgi:hypothetical protein